MGGRGGDRTTICFKTFRVWQHQPSPNLTGRSCSMSADQRRERVGKYFSLSLSPPLLNAALLIWKINIYIDPFLSQISLATSVSLSPLFFVSIPFSFSISLLSFLPCCLSHSPLSLFPSLSPFSCSPLSLSRHPPLYRC